MKKRNIFWLVGVTLFFFSFVCVDDLMFKKEKVCETKVNITQIIEKENIEILKSYFYSEQVNTAKTISLCSQNVIGTFRGDTLINLNETYLDLEYRGNYADSTYQRLWEYCKSYKSNTRENRLFDFFKPGKVLLLDTNSKTVRIITFNTCANMPKLDKIIDCVKTNSKYNQAFAVRCGGYDVIKIK
jgi:hypothetical protein